jgi:hypothetical protein
MSVRTHGYARKADVPLAAGTRAKVCGKCDAWFAAASRQRLCQGCVRPDQRVIRHLRKLPIENTGVAVQDPSPISGSSPSSQGAGKAPEAFGYEDLCRMWARRTARLTDWLERTGRPVREYPDVERLTAREISVAIGWVPWPESWPGQPARPSLGSAA